MYLFILASFGNSPISIRLLLPLINVINVGSLIFFGFARRWIAFGALVAFGAVLLVVTVLQGLFGGLNCFTFIVFNYTPNLP